MRSNIIACKHLSINSGLYRTELSRKIIIHISRCNIITIQIFPKPYNKIFIIEESIHFDFNRVYVTH